MTIAVEADNERRCAECSQWRLLPQETDVHVVNNAELAESCSSQPIHHSFMDDCSESNVLLLCTSTVQELPAVVESAFTLSKARAISLGSETDNISQVRLCTYLHLSSSTD